jgi:hypothetical protein
MIYKSFCKTPPDVRLLIIIQVTEKSNAGLLKIYLFS